MGMFAMGVLIYTGLVRVLAFVTSRPDTTAMNEAFVRKPNFEDLELFSTEHSQQDTGHGC